MSRPHVLSGGRYPVLRALAIMYLIGAALAIVGAVVGVCYIFAKAPGTILDRTILSVAGLIGAFLVIVQPVHVEAAWLDSIDSGLMVAARAVMPGPAHVKGIYMTLRDASTALCNKRSLTPCCASILIMIRDQAGRR